MHKIYTYETSKYKFLELILETFSVDELGTIHKKTIVPNLPAGVEGLGRDTHSSYHEMFYDMIKNKNSKFSLAYKQFIKNEIVPKFKLESNLIYQKLPSFRIQYLNSKAITTWHFDNDVNHKHPLGELNILVPFCDMSDTNTIWAESLPGLGDFSPMNCKYGDYIIWNGNRCMHGNKSNFSGITRVSMDFRVLPEVYYDENYSNTTATTGQRFIVGEYYSRIND